MIEQGTRRHDFLADRRLGFVGTVFFVVAMVLVAFECRSETNMLHVYYYSIGAETLKPITSENIMQHGHSCLIGNGRAVADIKNVIASAQRSSGPDQAFNGKSVRAKILERTGNGEALIALVENYGAVRVGTEDRFLPPDKLERLKVLIEASCGR